MATDENGSPRQLANGLGWFSIGLGLAEIAAPQALANLIGIEGNGKTRNILRFYGARELAAGIGILSQANPAGWLWARVAGDVLDLSSLGKAIFSDGNERGKTIAATAAVLGVTVADIRCAMQLSAAENNGNAEEQEEPAISSSVTIGRNASEVYGFWRNFERLPEIFDRLESVRTSGPNRSHWKLMLPVGRTLEWDAETTADEPNSRIAWRSVSTTAPHSGVVRFEPAAGNRGTKVTVQINWEGVGASFGKLLGLVPEQHVNIALHNLKQLLETGEVVKSDASIHRGAHAAQPPEQYPNRGSRTAVASA